MKTASNRSDTRERGKDRGLRRSELSGEFLFAEKPFERCLERTSREFINAEVETMIYDTEGSVSRITLSFLRKQILAREKMNGERERDSFIDYRRRERRIEINLCMNKYAFCRKLASSRLKI